MIDIIIPMLMWTIENYHQLNNYWRNWKLYETI